MSEYNMIVFHIVFNEDGEEDRNYATPAEVEKEGGVDKYITNHFCDGGIEDEYIEDGELHVVVIAYD